MKTVWLCLLLAILIAASIWLWRQAGVSDAGGPQQKWYFDLKTNTLFAAPMGLSPPIAAPSDGPGETSGVLAIVVTTPEGKAEIAYLMTSSTPSANSMPYALVRSPDGGAWVPQQSPESIAIIQRAKQLCEPGTIRLNFPTDK